MALKRYLGRMLLITILIVACIGVLYGPLVDIFSTNPALNGMIIGILAIGILLSVSQVISLTPELTWLSAKVNNKPLKRQYSPAILAPLVPVVGKNSSINSLTSQAILDSVHARLHESRDFMKYLVGLLVFMGLLGTFWGLSKTVGSVSNVINTLPTGGNTGVNFLEQLKLGLEAPLVGMGVAFSSSLFGLSASLILGFYELLANQARNFFYKQVEDNLMLKVNHAKVGRGDGIDGGMPAYIQALLEQTAENLDSLQRATTRTEEERQVLNANLSNLCDKMASFVSQRDTEKSLLVKMADNFVEFQSSVKSFSDKMADLDMGMDDQTKKHIRNLDQSTQRLIEATSQGQAAMSKEVRNEIRVLTRTLTNLASEEEVAASQS